MITGLLVLAAVVVVMVSGITGLGLWVIKEYVKIVKEDDA